MLLERSKGAWALQPQAINLLHSRHTLLPLDSPSPDGAVALNPGHFLTGHPLKAFLTMTATMLELSEMLASDIWKQWHRQYLQSLQSRSKWVSNSRNFRPGDVVHSPQFLKRTWPLSPKMV